MYSIWNGKLIWVNEPKYDEQKWWKKEDSSCPTIVQGLCYVDLHHIDF